MFNVNHLPLIPEQARAARNYFGWPQLKAADESGLPAHKLKRFEAGNYIPDQEFLDALRAFYEARGYRFDDTPTPGASAKSAGQVFPGGVVGVDSDDANAKRYRDRTGAAHVHHMRIALQDENQIGRAIDLIEENEESLAKLLRNPVETSFWGGFTDETNAKHAEAVRLLAENGMLFAKLFGREVAGKQLAKAVKAGGESPQTIADLLQVLQADAHLVAAGDQQARERRKTRPIASSIGQALGLS